MKKSKTTEQFVREANEIHHDKYDYSKAEYTNSKTKVCIICPEHGEFWQEANSHLKGSGCPKCCSNFKLTKETFIKRQEKFIEINMITVKLIIKIPKLRSA